MIRYLEDIQEEMSSEQEHQQLWGGEGGLANAVPLGIFILPLVTEAMVVSLAKRNGWSEKKTGPKKRMLVNMELRCRKGPPKTGRSKDVMSLKPNMRAFLEDSGGSLCETVYLNPSDPFAFSTCR